MAITEANKARLSQTIPSVKIVKYFERLLMDNKIELISMFPFI